MNARAAFSRSEAALEYRPVPTLDGSHAWHWVLLALPHRTCLGTGTARNRAQAGTQARLKARQVGRRISEIRIAGGALKEGKLPVPVNARDFILQKPARRECTRCGSWLDAEDYCEDETCPFSDHKQSCGVGWTGHPKLVSHRGVAHDPSCSCGGRVRPEMESVDPKDFIMTQPKGEDTPCGEPCGICGKPCTLVHRGTGRDSLVAGEHICQACDYNRFAGMLPENISAKDFIDYAGTWIDLAAQRGYRPVQKDDYIKTPPNTPVYRKIIEDIVFDYRINVYSGNNRMATDRLNLWVEVDMTYSPPPGALDQASRSKLRTFATDDTHLVELLSTIEEAIKERSSDPAKVYDALNNLQPYESPVQEALPDEPLPADPTKVAAKDFIMQQQTPEERLAQIATPGQKSHGSQLFSFEKSWPGAINSVAVVIHLYDAKPGAVTVWIKLYDLTARLINAEESEHCYQDQDACLDRLIPILQQIKASERPLKPDEISRLFKPLFDWMYQTSGKI